MNTVVINIYILWISLNYFCFGQGNLRSIIADDDVRTLQKLLRCGCRDQILRQPLQSSGNFIKDGNSALHLAVRYKSTKVLRSLLENGANIEILNYNNRTPLHLAAINPITFHSSLENTQSRCRCVEQWYFPMMKFIERCINSTISYASEIVPAVDIGRGGASPLDILLEYGADVNAKDIERCSPLKLAINTNNVKAARKLLNHGAVVTHVDDNQNFDIFPFSMLITAVIKSFFEMAEFLLNNGAQFQDLIAYGQTPLLMLLKSPSERKKTYFVKFLMRMNHDGMEELLLTENFDMNSPVDTFFKRKSTTDKISRNFN